MNPAPSTSSRLASTAQDEADAREFDAFARTLDPLDVEAATRVTRWRGGLDAEGEAELQAWLAADPAHADAFDDLRAIVAEIGQLAGDDVLALKAGLAVELAATAARLGPRQSPRPRHPVGRIRPAWLPDGLRRFLQPAAAAAALAVLAGGWLGWDYLAHQPTFTQRYASARGQQLNVVLPDGSHLHLDTATRADVRLYRDRREVRLADGQIMFAVRAAPAQPFHVFAGDTRVTVMGTRFSVRHTGTGLDAGAIRVMVEEGRVRVLRTAASGSGRSIDERNAVELGAGQTVVADAAGYPGAVVSMQAGSVAPWRSGRVSFDNTPLADALAEFERYGHTGLVVRDPAVAALRVGGSFSLQQLGAFTQALPQILPVRLDRREGMHEIVRAR